RALRPLPKWTVARPFTETCVNPSDFFTPAPRKIQLAGSRNSPLACFSQPPALACCRSTFHRATSRAPSRLPARTEEDSLAESALFSPAFAALKWPFPPTNPACPPPVRPVRSPDGNGAVSTGAGGRPEAPEPFRGGGRPAGTDAGAGRGVVLNFG